MLIESDYALSIPRIISDIKAAPLLCAGVIGYGSLRKEDDMPGEKVRLFGFGASAHLSIQVLRYWECETYVFTRSQMHRDHAFNLGAAGIGVAGESPLKLMDRAIIFAPSGWLVPEALIKIRPGGTLAINAIHMSTIPEMPYELMYGERTMRSVANAVYQDGVEFYQLAAKIPIKATISEYNLEDANKGLLDMKSSRINGEVVLKI